MMAKTTLYDLLGVPPTASGADIHAAQLRRLQHYQGDRHGLPPADAENRIKAIKEAAWVLSDPNRRAAYDASLAPALPEAAPAAALPGGPLPIEVEIKALKQRSPLRIMLTVIGGLMIVGMLVQIFISVFAFRQVSRAASGEAMTPAMERAAAAERRQTYGDLSDAEIAAQQADDRRRREEYVRTEAERRAEYERREEERRHEQALAERKRYADEVSSNLQRSEEAARQKAEHERELREARERQAEAEEERRLQERLARERARLRLGSGE